MLGFGVSNGGPDPTSAVYRHVLRALGRRHGGVANRGAEGVRRPCEDGGKCKDDCAGERGPAHYVGGIMVKFESQNSQANADYGGHPQRCEEDGCQRPPTPVEQDQGA